MKVCLVYIESLKPEKAAKTLSRAGKKACIRTCAPLQKVLLSRILFTRKLAG